ncbi:unnamed protein product [Malassezia sympodialis ATCC 42132]|nr:uncharacterized protein MSY001_0093 [Malassezia sympodialis ATCC 42132]CCU97387.1 unnamed protein product [Malassezia sympodialis ATCC 42132]|eukprot:XP_018738739.1 uncharacterized protein MSY001_0093 [Malassezia sympodialis ATCC 42132]
MDGWHYTRSQLDQMEDPCEAHRRRGAAFTFDAESFVAFVQRAQDCLDVPIWAPAFSHADKDPVPDAIRIEPTHRVLLFEGLYCCLDEEPWVQAARCWDRAWFLHVSTQVARSRLIQRHLESGIVHDEADAAERGIRYQ